MSFEPENPLYGIIINNLQDQLRHLNQQLAAFERTNWETLICAITALDDEMDLLIQYCQMRKQRTTLIQVLDKLHYALDDDRKITRENRCREFYNKSPSPCI